MIALLPLTLYLTWLHQLVHCSGSAPYKQLIVLFDFWVLPTNGEAGRVLAAGVCNPLEVLRTVGCLWGWFLQTITVFSNSKVSGPALILGPSIWVAHPSSLSGYFLSEDVIWADNCQRPSCCLLIQPWITVILWAQRDCIYLSNLINTDAVTATTIDFRLNKSQYMW